MVNSGHENSTHPLLVDPSGFQGGSHPHPRSSHRRTNRGNQAANAYTDLLQTIEDLVSGGALQLFQQLMSVGRGGPGELHIDLAPISTHLVPGLDRNAMHRHGRSAVFHSRLERPTRTEPRVETQDFGPLPTLQRWGEEAKMTHGKFIGDRGGKLANHVTIALLPAAREAAKQAKLKAKELEEQEELRRKEQDATKEKEALEANEGTAHEAPEAPAQVPTAIEEPEEESAEERRDSTVAPVIPEAQDHAIDEDTVMEDVSQTAETSDTPTQVVKQPPAAVEGIAVGGASTPLQDQSMIAPSAHPLPENEPGPSTRTEPGREEIAASGSSSSLRVTVMIHGNAVDITDTGIDPTFLEALPDDMREEVLNQHFRERRSARQVQPPESQISPEFLEALPPELRAEILQQETNERARFRAPAQPQAGTDPVGPVDIDPASFLASLDPQLRQVVLMDQEDGFLQTLPSHMIAEAGVWRERTRRFGSPPHGAAMVSSGAPQPETPRKVVVPRDAIQLLDKNGLATLVRLLFYPQLPRKNTLLKIFVNLCENSKTRAELLNLLLNILQDGTGDLAAVDKSFAQLSFRSRPQPSQATPKPSTKSKPSVDVMTSTSSSWQLSGESVPNLVVQRSLEALTFIVSTNESASRFFLTEHEIPSGLKRTSSRKGKGKEKPLPHVHYPIVPLLALLDGQTLLRTPSMMDSLAALLATVTRPLASLKDSNKKDDSSKDIVTSAPVDVTAGSSVSLEAGPAPTDTGNGSIDQSLTNVATGAVEPSTVLVAATQAVEPVREDVPSSLGESTLNFLVCHAPD